uniref:Uncharacterized protein n=1 Tax=Oryza sativa subsp. japonica TaxID=39947 RepID=Q2QS47_ORYSJ|nr:hypothetical protein LOC_Os12g25360 [Oryza sativa Japonica Group]
MAPASDTCGCGLASATCVGSDGVRPAVAVIRRCDDAGEEEAAVGRRDDADEEAAAVAKGRGGGGGGKEVRWRRRRRRGEDAAAKGSREEAVKGEESGDVLAFAMSNRSTTPRPLDTSTRGKMQPRAPIDFIGTSSLGGNATS